MNWLMGLQLFSSEGRKKIITIIIAFLCLVAVAFSFTSMPILLTSLPQTAFQSKEESEKTNQEYISILVDYKYKLHSDLLGKKREYNVERVKANYPSIALLIAYDNTINKNRLREKKTKINIDKNKVFSFLDNCIFYNLESSTLSSNIKSAEEISSYFKTEEDRKMFILIYTTVKKLDLDSKVPDIQLNNLDFLKGGIELPYFNQGDERWGGSPYGNSTIARSGCAIASMCMVLDGLIPNLNITPPQLANWSSSNGFYISGAGTSWGIFSSLAQKYNLRMDNLSRDNPQEILNRLGKGYPVVVSMSAGHFTRGGHFIVLRGISADGKILVSDPASIERSNQTWDFSIILTESSTLSPSCFWTFSK